MAIRTAIIRDDRYLDHKTGHVHPEHPSRLKAVYRMIDADFGTDLITIHPEPASLEVLELVHTPVYIEKVLKTAEHDFTSLAPDTPVSAMSYLSAWLAVGGCIRGLDALMSGECEACFALIRPPGHHALSDRAGGFCIFNNLGITARYALEKYELGRILIIDWDIHHGNGIQELFYEEKEVLYFSSHDPLLYPYTGHWEEIGSGSGSGYTVNIPLPRELEDREFLYLYREVLGSIVLNYQPELILIAAGFDAHHDDPIGRSRLNEATFGSLMSLVLELRAEVGNPPILLALEGGYNPKALANCVKEVFDVLTDRKNKEYPVAEKTRRGAKLVKKVLCGMY